MPDERDLRFVDHPAAAAPAIITTGSIDLRGYVPAIRNQLAENCCAQGTRDAAYACAKAMGAPIAEPSQAFLFAVTRSFENPKRPLENVGVSLRNMFKAMSDRSLRGDAGDGEGWGLIADERWPELVETINVVPPDDCWRAGENATIKSYHAIADGASSSEELLVALRRLRLSTICSLVDEKYAAIRDEVYDIPAGRILGSHCQLVVGYSAVLNAFLIRNSWGTDFGDLGYAWMSRGFVDRQTYGKWVIDVAPESLTP